MPNFPLNMTVLYAGLLALLGLFLAIMVTRARAASRVDLGDGGKEPLMRAIRVHANFCEYVPLALIVIGLTEMAGGPRWLVHALGVALVLGRVLHAQGLYSSSGRSLGRGAGTSLTWLVLLVAGAVCTYYGIVWRL
jgi:uncharacterized membrane protein YecN with MAPEG domain